jgi:hypothetical protein
MDSKALAGHLRLRFGLQIHQDALRSRFEFKKTLKFMVSKAKALNSKKH